MHHMQGEYNNWIIALSFFIAMAASYSAFDLAGKISRVSGRSRTIWLAIGSFIMGAGVWSMHFVGMMAFHLGVNVQYNVWTTAASMIFSIGASFIAFRVTSLTNISYWRRIFAGLYMGAGIVGMHYTGMAAIEEPVIVTYNASMVALSVGIAVGASYAALFLFSKLSRVQGFSYWKLICSVVMGHAVCGMHYTGMMATNFQMSADALAVHHAVGDSPPQFLMLITVVMATFLILAISAGFMFFDRTVLERMAYYDALTGLLNRHRLLHYFETSFTGKETGFLLFLDLDRFKNVNDTLGHDAGDIVIKETAERLKLTVTGDQTVFRLGGDEFLVASAKGSKDDALELAGNIVRVLRKPMDVAGSEIHLTISVGISLAPDHGTDRTALLKTADMALYQAKELGRNQYRLFDEEIDRQYVRRMELERDLRKALANEELFVCYQPKWDAKENRLIGLEALMRWRHPELGLVSPAEFIPIAEETGLIVPMTRWMLRDVCAQNRNWQKRRMANVRISVNMSIRVFEGGALAQMVHDALESSNLDPSLLELEITESIAMQEVADTVEQLQQLRALGVHVSMDDFGTGYSSLGSLDELPIDVLKIDQSFVRQSAMESKQAIISTIIAIAGHLKLQVVAEGVETQEQIEFLLSRGCSIMQGYYYGKPMDTKSIEQWFMDNQVSGQLMRVK
ncbi:bifunctional diguanylate cyclase/phosphodiesterase [Paenibacillus methanolicus]|uniref:Diguanylate cyclase (GGDEF)-like protein n=1 Tax=Paenibacillus methanolicus TaxID=582686 RepID=A0A5S5BR50_9BACL|nr:bifunctional diguanylate cyclase/phosphodiesterase [Paenibacillus methanolicus]TYP69414.1 diguanylate cyclase (GGDEF)-like protein [Paenibacillus methanolicus]